MTTEAETVHWTKSIRDESAPCGASFASPGIAATTKRYAVTCPACLTAMGEPLVVSGTDDRHRMAAPGAGEGREMTFAEAMLALINGKAVQFHKGEHGVDWHDCKREEVEGTLGLEELLRLAGNKYRLAPEPLPAPAPRPSRVAELAGTWTMSGKDPQACVLDAVTRAVEETLEAAQAAPAGYRPSLTEAIARARAAMLEPRK